jgi:hypothetical protein
LAADNLGERFPFIVALFLVVKSWRGDQPKIFEASEENVCNFSGHTTLLSFEKLVVKYYYTVHRSGQGSGQTFGVLAWPAAGQGQVT